MRELRQFKLPLLVEARKKEESDLSESSESAKMDVALHVSTSSLSTTDAPSPTTPTFSLRGHSRFPSSTSSLASSPILNDSMDGYTNQKRPLTDVKEEPQDDYEMVNHVDTCREDGDDMFKRVQEVEVDYSEDCSPSPNDYDLADDAQMDFDLKSEQSSKRQRAGEITVSNLTSRFGSRIPSFSRKWRHRRAGNTKVGDDHSAESGLSRANSTRASSLAGSLVESTELPDPQLPPTPTRNVITGDVETSHLTSIDVQKANAPNDEEDSDRKASTPLLPPILTQISTQVKETPFQSPLQSPTIAPPPVIASHDSPSSLQNPQLRGPSSPPLSTKPSVTSFHCPPGQLQTSEIPPLLITKNDDEWANKLGHANFTILPEPYLPNRYDPPACKRLRSDWDLARCNYMKHLMRAREHYGATSKIYRLIEEKWAEIDSIWKSNYDLTMSRATDAGFGAELSLSQSPIAEPVPLIKLPSLNGPGSEGKFPKLGDEGIVGPMEQLARPLQLRRSSKKAGILKLLHNVLPGHTGFWGRSVRTRSFSP